MVCGMIMDKSYNHGLDAGLNHGKAMIDGDMGLPENDFMGK